MNEQLTLIYGNDEFAVAEQAKASLKKWLGDGDTSHAVDVIDGDVKTIGDAITVIADVCNTLKQVDLFGDQKVIWLQNVSFLSTANPGKSADVKAALTGLMDLFKANLQGNNRLLVTVAAVDKRGAFYKWITKSAEVFECSMPDKPWLMDEYARTHARRLFDHHNLKISDSLLEEFVQKSGTNVRQFASEVEKLSVYLGEKGEVTSKEIRLLVTPTREAAAWDLADALGAGNLGVALSILRQLLSQRESTVGLLMGLSRRFREMLILRECMDRGWLSISGSGRYQKAVWADHPDAEALLGAFGNADPRKLHSYRVMLLAQQAKRFSSAALQRGRTLILDCHETAMSSVVPEKVLLEVLLLKIHQLQRR